MNVYDLMNETAMGSYLTRREWGFIDGFLNDHAVGLCLDLACGTGRISIPVVQRGINIVSVDYDLEALRVLEQKQNGSLEVVRGDGTSLPFRRSVFDCVICIQAMGNIDPELFIRECSRVLKRGGYLLFNISNKRSYKCVIHRVLSRHRIFYRFTFEDVRRCLEDEGFTVVDSRGYNWLPHQRKSDSTLIPYFARLEEILGLERLPAVSPHLFIIAKKSGVAP